LADKKILRKIAVIFVTDVVGFSKMMEANEDQTLQSFRACKEILDKLFEEHGGRIFNTAGDSVLAEFQSAVSAMVCAAEFQKLIKQRNSALDTQSQMNFRIGLNMGDVIVEGDNLYGDGVNVAARLEALCQPGGVCLSKAIHDFVGQKVELTFNDIGQQKVKNTDVHAFDLVLDGSANREVRSEPMLKTENDERELGAIAVLPFENQSNDPEQDFFVDGITDDIIANLSLWRTFPVISRNSSFVFKGKKVSANDVAQELGARYVVQGSIRKGGQRVRITAQLVDAEKDRQLWSERWDRSLEDIFDVQDEVSAAVAAQVNPAIQIYEVERIERARPTNLTAWELYLKALHTFNERTKADHYDPGVVEAKKMCEQVIELDKNMSHAYSLMADIYFAELGQFLSEDSSVTLQKIYDYAKIASDLEPKNSVAANLIASHFFFSGKFDKSKLYAERAVKLNPSFPEALYRLGQSLVHSGNYSGAEQYYHKAISLSPLDPNSTTYKNGLFFANLGQGNFDVALSYNDECRLQFPNVGTYKGFNAATLGHLNRDAEAKIALKEYLALRPNLKKKSDYKKIFVPNSTLADILIEGLVKASWQPEDEE